ncbi:Pex19-domain-containing protein [Epithele typhae]|uniref:Pex19-domain-containing protein n=1 Tax=Epithele typhae TaxID=378194 RepID=UPI0020086125|nr:Pex19-domain-containing protein [Epithele typhae]KAH9915458.1 Pex19-domain-containing protein [Epithele typhae]
MEDARRATVEDEDLDDLDDVLEQFTAPPRPPPPSATSPPAAQPSSSSSAPTASASVAPPAGALDGLDDDFARELTKGMEELFKDVASGAGLGGVPAAGDGDAERERAFKAAWEAMLVESMNGSLDPEDLRGGAGTASTSTAGAGSGSTESFQDNIRKAMEKMKESDRKADEAASQGGDGGLEDLFARLGGDLGGEESEEDLKGMLEQMMSQLMSKEILYEPLKELHDKFPGYIKEHESTMSAEDKTRYESQYKVVGQIVGTFEDASYSDEDAEKGLKIVELMQEMQEFGSPPSEIMGPLPPGFDLGADGLPRVPDGCTIG